MLETAVLEAESARDGQDPCWVASWAEANPRDAWVHRYFFVAADYEAATEKVFAWMRRPARPLPKHARIIQKRWIFPAVPEHPLLAWQVSWLEEGEKHTLLLFEPPGRSGAARRARAWAEKRRESLAEFQILVPLEKARYQESYFDPCEGEILFFC